MVTHVLSQDLCSHELIICYVELTSCYCCLHSTSTQAYSQDPVPENAAYCQQMLLFATLSDLETAVIRQNILKI